MTYLDVEEVEGLVELLLGIDMLAVPLGVMSPIFEPTGRQVLVAQVTSEVVPERVNELPG